MTTATLTAARGDRGRTMAFSGVFPPAGLVPAPFGLSSVATVVNHPIDDNHWVIGYEQEYALCNVLLKAVGVCDTPIGLSDTTGSERFGHVKPFDVIIREGCDSPLGPSLRREREQRLMDLLDITSWKALEHELWTGAVTIADEAVAADRNKYLGDSSVVNLGAGEPLDALSIIEDALAEYGSGERGVIHMSRGAAAALGSVLHVEGDQLVTPAGTLVAAGTGYYPAEAMYGTGPVLVHLGKAAMLSDSNADYFDPASNTYILQAERPVAVTWDGCTHVRMSVSYSPVG